MRREERTMLKFINSELHRKFGKAPSPTSVRFWQKFVAVHGGDRTPEDLAQHSERYLLPRLYEADLPLSDILNIYGKLDIKVDPTAVKKIEKKFSTKLRVLDNRILGVQSENTTFE
ncbi:unnamed protein product, partial [Caenorhabditis auriculariae]